MSYRLKLTLAIVLLIAVTFSLGGTVLIDVSFRTALNAETEAAVDAFGNAVNTLYLLNAVSQEMDIQQLGDTMKQITGRNSRTWQAAGLWSGDTVIYQRGGSILHRERLPLGEEDTCSYLPVRDGSGSGLLIGGRILIGGQSFDLLGRFDLSGVYEARQSQEKIYRTIYLAVVVFGLITAVILSYVLTGRLRRLTTAVRKFAGGRLDARSRITSRDEFGQLSRDFNIMADRLQENITMLENNMERQENFMGAFSHELKTPMTSIIGFADLLRQGNLDESTRMMAAEYIYSEAHRLERLSLKMLDLLLLKKDAVTMKCVSLPALTEEIDRALSGSLRSRGIRLVCRPSQGTAVMEPDLIKSLLYNLIDNASKAIEGEGIIVLQASPMDGGCRFQVFDNGRGMEQAELSRITDAFYRVDKARSRSQGGAGLGLALCKLIVELHHGTIRFASVPGKGTRVQVTLREKGGEDHG